MAGPKAEFNSLASFSRSAFVHGMDVATGFGTIAALVTDTTFALRVAKNECTTTTTATTIRPTVARKRIALARRLRARERLDLLL
jgi:hypothetical protein